MKIKEAKICLDCDEIYEGTTFCPNCSGRIAWPLREWIGTIGRESSELQEPSTSELLFGERSDKALCDPEMRFHRA
jgi:hypothetical protein